MTELQEKLLASLRENNTPKTEEELKAFLRLDDETWAQATEELLENGQLMLTKQGAYALPAQLGFMPGVYRTTAGTAAFFSPDDGGDDCYVANDGRMSAMDGDRVLCRPYAKGRRGDVEVVRVMTRAAREVIGVYRPGLNGGMVDPTDSHVKLELPIPRGEEAGAYEGALVRAEIVAYADARNGAWGRVVEVLGMQGATDAEYKAILRSHGIHDDFPPDVKAEARLAPDAVDGAQLEGRTDYRGLLCFTIDGADAKDLDDAISLETLPDGWRLGVHIADVSHYVRENTALDREAFERGTSTYLPGLVVPMLPGRLSNGICSLNGGVERHTMSCVMHIGRDGQVRDSKIGPSIIKSAARLTYDAVNRALEQADATDFESMPQVLEVLREMNTLREVLFARREARGSVEMDIDEPEIITDTQGHPVEIRVHYRGIANRLIEEFMLIANETVAKWLSERHIPCVYRVHDIPDPERMESLAVFLQNLGFSPKGLRGQVEPKTIQRVLMDVHGTKYENILNQITLRSMKKALYSTENRGHFGLAAKDYCHFTSPIRRYPDLLVHRMIRRALQGPMDARDYGLTTSMLEQMAVHASQRERDALEAERDAQSMLMARYMAQHVGEQFAGVVSGVTEHGLYVQLTNLCEGFIRVSAMDGWWEYDERFYCLRARGGKAVITLGDPVEIQVASVDEQSRHVNFDLVDYAGKPAPKPQGEGNTNQRQASNNHTGNRKARRRRGYRAKP